MGKVLLGVTGCIAAYKACEILRALQRAGVDVTVAMTPSATEFVGVRTFEALSGHPVGVDVFEGSIDPIPHIRLAEGCDAMLIAPCTANVLAKLACGIADDLLTSTALACTSPIMVAPAMNVHMYGNAATQANIATLKERGFHVLDPDSGYLACGDVGAGKLPDPQDIADALMRMMGWKDGWPALAGRKVLITSGPTVEPIDAVRYVSNRSSGKMGAALAAAALAAGAQATVVSGPVSVSYPEGADAAFVGTAEEMLAAARAAAADADIIVCAAAVADYRPADPSERKLKKGADDAALESIRMVRNPDILKALAAGKRAGQVVIGFAAETDDVLANAEAKLRSKGADMIVANEVGEGKAFGQDADAAALVTAQGAEQLPEMSKSDLARRIMGKAAELLAHSA